MKKEEDKTKEKQKIKGELKGKCLKCGKAMFKNHKSCKACNRKKRLKAKANKRGKSKRIYI
jgi:uncharacterized OB-fold protein